jgi:hypothetical protein
MSEYVDDTTWLPVRESHAGQPAILAGDDRNSHLNAASGV